MYALNCLNISKNCLTPDFLHVHASRSKLYLSILNLTILAALPTLYCPVFEDFMAKSTLIHAGL